MPDATQTQIRRDTRTNLNSATPANSELAHDTTNNRINIGNGSRLGGFEIPNFSDIQNQVFGSGTVSGTDTLTLTLTPALLAYASFTSVEIKAANTNTTAVTININSLGAKNIKKMKNGALASLEAGDIIAGGIYRITYDGTQFQIKSLNENEQEDAGLTLLSVTTGGGSTYDITSNIDTTYENYLLVLQNILLSTNAVDFILRVRRAGQGSFDSGSSDYGYIYNRFSNTTSSAVESSDADNTSAQILLLPNVLSAGAQGISGTIMCYGLGQSARAVFDWSLGNYRSSTGFVQETARGRGGRDSATALDGVRLLPDTGTITSGDLYLYGVRSAL